MYIYFLIFFFLDKEILFVVKYDDINFEENIEVRKIGKEIGIIEGCLIENIDLVIIDGFIFKNCFVVRDMNGKRFFECGDFGLGVFLKEEKIMKVLGIVFVFMNK